MVFRRSSRLPVSLEPSPLALARSATGPATCDLTVTNPTRCGLAYPTGLLEPLASPAGLGYAPHPRGPLEARRAVASTYRKWGLEPDPDRVVLTASTSEAYALLFKLTADPGDAVLVPTPSYPLLEHLTRLEGVGVVPYRLDPEAGWRIERETLSTAPSRVRAVVVVHPNNPTGSFVHPDDAGWLGRTCAERGWSLIADEVFLPFPLDGGPGASSSFAASRECLTFTLGGFSKSLGLPQVKLGWIVVSGPDVDVACALEGLDHVCDAYLSVATPVAHAAADLIARAAPVATAISVRCRSNLDRLRALARRVPALSVDPPGGGWSAVLRFPSVIDEDRLVLALLAHRGVAVQPGYLFDFERPGRLVLSLLPDEQIFHAGVERLLDELGERTAAL